MSVFTTAKLLYVDLSNSKIWTQELEDSIYRKYPGGSSLALYLLLKEMPAGVDPLSAENVLIFSVSPLTGMPISGQSRMNVAAKSPLTGGAGDSQVGGYIPAQLKANGYDAVIFKGKAEKPTYLLIDGENVELKEATHIWGKTTGETEDQISADLEDSRLEMSVIGPAGENLSKMACIIHRKSRANGRNGMGAVMGSKNLKALVVKKQATPKPMNPEALKYLTREVRQLIQANEGVLDLSINGTAGTVEAHQEEGFLPTRNWSEGYLEDCEKIYGRTIVKEVLKNRGTCHACAIRCKAEVEIEGKVSPEYGGPEYETCATFGSYCGNTNLEHLCLANQACNMYGLDTISCGATIAFAMDCYDNNVLSKEDTDGLDLIFGNGEIFVELIEKIAQRTPGIGELLADGSAVASEKIGVASNPYLVTCKRQEVPAHMVQMKPNMALNYALNDYGADHQSTEMDPALMAPEDSQDWEWTSMMGKFDHIDSYGILDDNKAKFTFAGRRFYSMMDTLCLCQFAWGPAWQLYGPKDLLDFIKASIGIDMTIEELMEIGERRLNLLRIFNYREGFTQADDKIPEKLFLAIPDGPGKGVGISRDDFTQSIATYYELAGWDKNTGAPNVSTLKKLDLEWTMG